MRSDDVITQMFMNLKMHKNHHLFTKIKVCFIFLTQESQHALQKQQTSIYDCYGTCYPNNQLYEVVQKKRSGLHNSDLPFNSKVNFSYILVYHINKMITESNGAN